MSWYNLMHPEKIQGPGRTKGLKKKWNQNKERKENKRKKKTNKILSDWYFIKIPYIGIQKMGNSFFPESWCATAISLRDDGQLGKGDQEGSAQLQGSHRCILLRWQLTGNRRSWCLTTICFGNWSIPWCLFIQKIHSGATWGSRRFQRAAEEEILSWCTGVGPAEWTNNFFLLPDLTSTCSAERTQIHTLRPGSGADRMNFCWFKAPFIPEHGIKCSSFV